MLTGMSLGMAFPLSVDALDAQASVPDRPTTRRCFTQIGRAGELRVQLCVALGHSPHGEIFVDVPAAFAPIDVLDALDRPDHRPGGIHNEPRHSINHDLRNGPLPERQYRRAGRHGLDQHHPEGLAPPDRKQRCPCVSKPVLLRSSTQLSDVDDLFVAGQDWLHHVLVVAPVDRMSAHVDDEVDGRPQAFEVRLVLRLFLDATGENELRTGLLRNIDGAVLSLDPSDPTDVEEIVCAVGPLVEWILVRIEPMRDGLRNRDQMGVLPSLLLADGNVMH